MAKEIDARGLSCPEPVIMARNGLKDLKEKEAVVLVSSSVAKDNVSRAAGNMGWSVSVSEEGGDFRLTLTK